VKFAWDFSDPIVIIIAVLAFALVGGVAAVLVWSSYARARATARIGDEKLVRGLMTADATALRAVKGALFVAGLALVMGALARPQYGKGKRLVPATNLDVVIVLDYSKSMYARDVVPNRISRAKAEIGELTRKLPGARFGAVAFAGQPMSFPLTTDGAAIAAFFRQLEPNDMPVGGTATARALEYARDLFARDPKSKDHVRVILLVTDGEDLEGDPVKVADECAQEGTRIDVVQIGGRAPEVIPEMSPEGKVLGPMKDEAGKPVMTELTQEAEAQLSQVATKTNGKVVESKRGATGIDEMTADYQRMMREELSEKVETLFAEVYAWPLFFALALLGIETFIPETIPAFIRARRRKKEPAS
jgi:Ca-activated chloride channel family protein